MAIFRVGVKEVHVQEVIIEANNEEEAISMVREGEGDEVESPYYSYTLDSDEWKILETIEE